MDNKPRIVAFIGNGKVWATSDIDIVVYVTCADNEGVYHEEAKPIGSH